MRVCSCYLRWVVFLALAGSQAFLPAAAHAAGTIRYVVPGGLSAGSCDSWGTACELQRAISVAVSGDQVWVKEGTHVPLGSSRTGGFTLKDGVSILGGFAGTETLEGDRNPAVHVTTLSGDIGVGGDASDNVYHVVTAGGVNSSAVLDGFTITAGYADGSFPHWKGGGIYNDYGSSPALVNLTITGNSANSGGGIYNGNGSNPSLANATISANSAVNGGGMATEGSSPALTDVSFNTNSATGAGAGMANNSNSNPTLTNVTFSGNFTTLGFGGAMMNSSGSSPILTNVTFNANSAYDGAGLYNSGSSPTLTNVTFSGNTAVRYGGAMYNKLASNVVITNGIFWNDGLEFYTTDSSPTITDSIVMDGCPDLATACDNVIDADPLLDPLADNGGFTLTMALGAGSPAIDAGGISSTCAAADQRGIPRPQGAACDMGAYEAPVVFRSIGSQDGWTRESGERTNKGGSLNGGGATLRLGDDASRRQYRSILSFSTEALPDDAIISSAQLRLKRSSVTPSGSNPISRLKGVMVDLKYGIFGSTSALQLEDFKAAGNVTSGPFKPTLSGGFYTIDLDGGAFAYINPLSDNEGLTQIRLRFKLDDNNNGVANVLNLASGDDPAEANRPALIIVYTTP